MMPQPNYKYDTDVIKQAIISAITHYSKEYSKDIPEAQLAVDIAISHTIADIVSGLAVTITSIGISKGKSLAEAKALYEFSLKFGNKLIEEVYHNAAKHKDTA